MIFPSMTSWEKHLIVIFVDAYSKQILLNIK